MSKTQDEYAYIPGACNLGKQETGKRYRAGFIGLALILFSILIIESLGLHRTLRWLIFIPACYAMSGFVQGYFRFCFVYGYKGVFSIKGLRHFGTSTDALADRKQALKVAGYSLVGALLITLIYYFIPFGK